MPDAHYTLLKPEASDLENDGNFREVHKRPMWTAVARPVVVLLVLLCCSLALNVFALSSNTPTTSDLCRSPYSGLSYDVLRPFEPVTDYWGENESLSNELWEAIDTNPMGVALADPWAAERGLPRAGRFPWDDEKGTYYVKVFHQLHCLKLIRRLIVDLRAGRESVSTWSHSQHCLDSLRKDLICAADDTPIYGRNGAHLGEGQVMRCRNFDKLVEWTQAPERNACFRSLSDYERVEHTLERFAFCPPDSQYYDVQNAYFERWGHKDPLAPDP